MNFSNTYNIFKFSRTKAIIIASLVIVAFTFLFSIYAPEVLAQQSTTNTQNGDAGGFVPCGNTADNPCQIGHLFSAFVVIVNYMIAMAGFVAVVFIVIAGLMMIYSQGQEKMKEAKGRLSGAVIGLVLVAAAFILINAIFTGSLSLGIKQGGDVLTNPLDYIQSSPSKSSNSNGDNIAPVDDSLVATDDFAPIISTRPGTGEKSNLETTASLLEAPNAEFCPIRAEGIKDKIWNLILPKVVQAERIACKEVKLGSAGGSAFPYLLRQQEYPGNYPGCPKAGDVPSGGCGPTSLGMVLWAFSRQVRPPTVAPSWQTWLNQHGKSPYNPWAIAQLVAHTGGRGCETDGEPNGSTNDFAVKVMPYYGGSAYVTTSESAIDGALEDSNYVIARMKKNTRFTSGGHFVVIWGVEKNYMGSGQKWYKFADPNSRVDVRLARSTIFYEDLNDAQVIELK